MTKKIIYRKHLGLVGFWLICAHGVLTLMLPAFPFAAFFLPQNQTAFFAAVGALIILIMMAIISNQFAVRDLGGARWRMLLRTGYLAMILGTIHFSIKKLPLWQTWLYEFPTHPLPPLSLFVSIFVGIVIILRIALALSLWHKKRASL